MKLNRWLAVILWMSLIFFWSSIPDLKSSLPTLYDTILRKGAHIGEYLVLAWLVSRAWDNLKRQWFVLVFCLVFAASDEFHQLFVRDRSGQLIDVAVDTVGILIGLWLYLKISVNKKTSRS
jgi:VanZ family protein